MPVSFDFSGKVAIVTGGGSGIGEATAIALLKAGAKVAIAGRKADRLEAAAAAMRETTGGEVFCFATDVRVQEQCQALIEAVVAHFGRLDVLINNAGGARHAALRTAPVESWRQDMALNLDSAFFCSQSAYPHLKAAAAENGQAAIVNISSMAGNGGTMGCGGYSAAKAGLQMLTRVAAAEWGPKGIRVNAVAAGMIATPLARANWAKTGFDAASATTAFPLRRPGEPEEVARTVLFMASDAASYITGETLICGGGPTIKGMIDTDD
ncbi:SDR family NAD(P)-dependent oxidoreductase [Novosphingobium sp. TH158]|uniref:SDR family NAD(P)-dependent oxidoreductase n=1 Tax=Novosphingobium sp. TH158 TaxID=2067455 RepID=UPI000C7DEC07|nr:SDR family oxidoreductase [Novosphingobium sp. TH158]PLK24463.1 NAD(P)-dependent oxidoreductase [Novosphingobium sp. TH158]